MFGLDYDDESVSGPLPGTTFAVDETSALNTAGTSGIAQGTGTGQHGQTLVTGGSMGSAFQSIWDWLNEPFKTPLAPLSIFALIGTVLIAIILWNLILYHIRIASEAL
jgi:hypothetical protein